MIKKYCVWVRPPVPDPYFPNTDAGPVLKGVDVLGAGQFSYGLRKERVNDLLSIIS